MKLQFHAWFYYSLFLSKLFTKNAEALVWKMLNISCIERNFPEFGKWHLLNAICIVHIEKEKANKSERESSQHYILSDVVNREMFYSSEWERISCIILSMQKCDFSFCSIQIIYTIGIFCFAQLHLNIWFLHKETSSTTVLLLYYTNRT